MESYIRQASKLLEEGKLVSFPTETVFALAANAQDEKALESIFKVKGRENKKPLALLVENTNQAKKYVKLNKNALLIMQELCPGPISLVLPMADDCNLPKIINGGINTLSVRIPDHKTALAILNEVNCPIVATSANISGKPDALSAKEVEDYFGNKIDYIIEGEGCSGEASTVVDLCGEYPKILRQGKITMDDILKIIEK